MTHITQRLHPHCFADSEKKILHEQYVVRHWFDGGHWPPCNWRVCLLTVTLLQWRHVSITVSLNTGNSTGSSKNANNKEDFRAPYNWESTSDRWILSQRASNAEIRSGDYALLDYKRKIFLWTLTSNSFTENEEDHIPSHILKTLFGLNASVILRPKYVWFPVHSQGPVIPDPSGQLAEVIVYITSTREDLYSHQMLLCPYHDVIIRVVFGQPQEWGYVRLSALYVRTFNNISTVKSLI